MTPALNKCKTPSICLQINKEQLQFFFKKNMGSSHPKPQQQRKMQRTPTDKWTMKLSDKQNLQTDEIIPVQIIETKNFRFSKAVEASRNLMCRASDPCQQTMQIDKNIFNICQQLLVQKEEKEVLVLPIIKSIFNQAVKKPIYAMIEIDPKRFITIRNEPLRLFYTILNKIGQGSYGMVFKAELVSQKGQFRAIKQIEKSQMDNQIKLSFINQFQILKKLDHPNIIKLYEIFEDQKHYYVVSQLCDGGNLLEFINNHCLTENGVKLIMRQILGAVKYMHSLNILHRDLKLENVVVVERNSKKVDIKIIDFGLSISLEKGVNKEEETAGSLIYMAPECIEGTLCLANDIWSCGIILYMLATKKIPYKFKNDEDLIEKIEKGLISRKYLHTLNLPLKMTINFMIDKDPNRRHSADKIMQSQWLKTDESQLKVSHSQRKKVAVSLFNYNIKNNLIAMIQSYISFKRIAQNERQRLAKIFEEIDKDKSGMIDIAQFKQFYAEYSENYCEKEVEELLGLIDKNKSGKIDFNEFIGAIYSRRKLFQVKNLEEVFDYFDKDNSGFIQKNELKEVLIGIQDKEIEFLFLELDKNSDNMIEKSELIAYIQKQYQK